MIMDTPTDLLDPTFAIPTGAVDSGPGPSAAAITRVGAPDLATGDAVVPALDAPPIQTVQDLNPYATSPEQAFAARVAANMPDRIPTVTPDGKIGGDVSGYAARIKANDPVTAAAIKAAPDAGAALLQTILADRQAEEKIASTPPGQDPLQDLAVYSYASRRGLLPQSPGALTIAGSMIGDLWGAAKGLATTADLAAIGSQLGPVDSPTSAEARSDTGQILGAGFKKAIGDSLQLAGGAGALLERASNHLDAALDDLTPKQVQDLRISTDYQMYKLNTAIAGSQQKTLANLEQLTNLPPDMLADAVNGISQVANPVNYLPIHDAVAAVAGGTRAALGLGTRSLPGVTEGAAIELRKATSVLAGANSAFDAVAMADEASSPELASRVQEAGNAVKAAQTSADTAQAAYDASVASDEAAQAKALQAPLSSQVAGKVAQVVGKALQIPAKGFNAATSFVDNRIESLADGNEAAKTALKAVANKGAAALAGAAADVFSPDEGEHPWLAAMAATLGVESLKVAGTDLNAMGRQLVLGKVALPYFARLAADTSTSEGTRWVAQNFLDPLTPYASPFLDKAAAGLRGAAAATPYGAAFGYVQSGGDPDAAVGGALGITALGFTGGLAGSLTPAYLRDQAALTGEANRQYLLDRWKDNAVATARFQDLSLAQQTELASWVHASPDFTPLFIENPTDRAFARLNNVELPANPDSGVTFKASDGRVYVALNPDDSHPFGPVIAHELRHVMQLTDPALADDVKSTLVGNAENGVTGIFTRRDAAGDPITITNADGTASYDVTDEFKALKANYEARVSAATKQPYTLSNADFALEHDAEESAQTWLQTGSFDQSIRPTVSGILASKFQDAPFLRQILSKFGNAFYLDGEITGPASAFKGIKATADTQKLVRAYTDAWARRSPDAVQPEAPSVDLSAESLAKNPGLLELLDASNELARDPATGRAVGLTIDQKTGKTVVADPKKLFRRAAEVNADNEAMTAAVLKGVEESAGANPANEADSVQKRPDGIVGGRFFTNDQLARIKASGAFNDIQFSQLKNLNDLLRSGKGNFIRSFYQPALGRSGKYASRSGHWVEEVPYGFRVTKADNITIQSIAPDKLARNLESLWSQQRGPARSLWTNTAEMFQDADTYLRDLAAGKPGATSLGEQKRNAINAALGIKGTSRADVNPVYDATPQKSLTSAIVSRRLDRTNRMQPGLRSNAPVFTRKTYELARENFTPGEPHYTPGVDSSSVEGSTVKEEAGPNAPTEDQDRPYEISTRTPSAVSATEDPLASTLTIGPEHVLRDADTKREIASLITKYPGTPAGKETPNARLGRFTDDAVSNLLWLHDLVPQEIRERSKLWYDGGHKLISDMADRFGVPRPTAAAVAAALSPQKDWFMNVDLARRVIETRLALTGTALSSEAAAWYARKFGEKDSEGAARLIDSVGISFEQLNRRQKAIAVRAYDEIHNPRSYPVVNPEGTFGDVVKTNKGADAKIAWGDFGSIGKAISVIEDGSRENISKQLGDEHKVRSFYNNLLLPNDAEHGHVTIDTHAVAAALLRPLAGSDPEVIQNFGGAGAPSSSVNGASGTYGLYAGAYREAAQLRGILPREMQSITWEAVRGLFPAEWKTEANKLKVDAIWKNYKNGTITIDEARTAILDLAGGIKPPSWFGPDARRSS